VVTGGGEAVGPGGVVGDPGPAGGEEVVRYRRVRRAAEAPVEVDRLVVAGDHRGPGQVGVGEVLGRERRICRWWWGVTRCERELRHRTATVLEVLQHDLVGTLAELPGDRVRGRTLESPVVDDEGAVDVEPHAVVG